MANCYIDFRCVQQGLERTDDNVIAEGVAKKLFARFDLCPKWDGLKAYARFKHMNAVYDVPIIDSCAEIPAEVVKYTGFEVSVFGEDGEGGRLTSAMVFNEVKRGIDAEGVAPMPATPSMIDTLISKASKAEADAAAVRAAADAGVFTGAPFYISHVFGSIEELEAFEGAAVGEFAIINCGAEFEENARVYQREEDGWLFVADMSGTPGKDGDAVFMGASMTAESDGNGTFTFGVVNWLDPKGVSIPVPVEQGGTGATDAAAARRNLGVPAITHNHDGVYSPAGHTHTPEDVGAAPSSHYHDYYDIESAAAPIMANQGNAPLVHILPTYNADAAVTPSGYNVIAYSPATGMIHVNTVFTTTAEVASGTPLFYLPFEAFKGNSYTSAALATVFGTAAAATLAQAFNTSVTVKALNASVEGCGVGVTLGSKVGKDRRIVIEGALPTHCLWFRHDPTALEKRRDAVCQAMRDMEGLYTYSNKNAGRLTPETSGYTDCSGTTYTAYKRALGWNIGSVEDYQASRGRHIARFAKGEEIPLWLLQKADLLLLYKENSDVWSHVAMYMGDNVLWDMSTSAYPNGTSGSGPYLRSDNVSTGLASAWPNAAWSHVDVVRFIV